MFPEPTELLLIGYFIESIWTPKIQIKYNDTKNQLADILVQHYEQSNVSLQAFQQSKTRSSTMSKRQMQEKPNKEKKLSAWLQNRDLREIWSLDFRSVSNMSSSSSSHSPENLRAKITTLDSFTTGKHAAMDSNQKQRIRLSSVEHRY